MQLIFLYNMLTDRSRCQKSSDGNVIQDSLQLARSDFNLLTDEDIQVSPDGGMWASMPIILLKREITLAGKLVATLRASQVDLANMARPVVPRYVNDTQDIGKNSIVPKSSNIRHRQKPGSTVAGVITPCWVHRSQLFPFIAIADRAQGEYDIGCPADKGIVETPQPLGYTDFHQPRPTKFAKIMSCEPGAPREMDPEIVIA